MKNRVVQVVSDKIVFVGEIGVGGMRFHFRLRIFAKGGHQGHCDDRQKDGMTARGMGWDGMTARRRR